MDPPDEINGIVRNFSNRMIESYPENQSVVALAQQEADDINQELNDALLPQQWKLLFEPDFTAIKSPEENMLELSGKALARAWLKYQKHRPKDQRVKKGGIPANLGEIIQAVSIVQESWEKKKTSKGFKAKSLFLRLCSGLNDYRDLFAIIPSNDKYLSLLTGSLSTIVKASANHEKLCQGISDGLDSIGEDISYWRRQLDLHHNNEYMRRYVAKLYVVVFKLFIDILAFYSSGWERFKLAFDQKALENIVTARKGEIKELSSRLNDEAKLAAEAQVLNIEETWKKFGLQICGLIANEFQAQAASQDIRLGKTIQRALRDEARSNVYETMYKSLLEDSTSAMPSPKLESLILPASSFRTWTKAEVCSNAASLQQFHETGVVGRLLQTAPDVSINIEIFSKIQQWSANSQPQALWVCGPARADTPSRYSIASAYIANSAMKLNVPVISVFCRRKLGILELTLSLIFQLVELLPFDNFSTSADLSDERFDFLLQTQSQIPDVLLVFQDLLELSPSPLLCIIDGLQNLKFRDASEETAAQEMIALLCKPQPLNKVVKSIFTTDGFVSVLDVLQGGARINTLDFELEENVGSVADSEGLVLLRAF